MNSPKLIPGPINRTDISHMSHEDIFKWVYKGLDAQKWERSGKDDGYGRHLCYYLNGNGAKCAVGQLLTDETLKQIQFKDLNQKPLHQLIIWGYLVIDEHPAKRSEMTSFLSELQSAHDLQYSVIPEEDGKLRKQTFLAIAGRCGFTGFETKEEEVTVK